MQRVRFERARLLMLIVLGSVLAGCVPGGAGHSRMPVERMPVEPLVQGVQTGWRETRFSMGCSPGPVADPPPNDEPSVDSGSPSDGVQIVERMRLRVDLGATSARAPLLGTGFNLEHGLWSCATFHPVLDHDLLEPFRPALARIDTGLLPVAPAGLPAPALNREVYQAVLASEPYAGQWQMLREGIDKLKGRTA